jgi:RNA polymerase sigma-70 factor (ECF subfamily)
VQAVESKNIFTEEELVQNLKALDKRAFALLYDNYGAALLGVINNLVNNNDEAENLLQDVFVKVWKYINRYDHTKGRLYTWLVTICRNTALNYLRSQENIRKVEIRNTETGVYTQRLITEPKATDHIGLQKVVEKLEEKHRTVIDLIYYWGYTQQEVAKKLDLPLGTVKTRTRTALQLLKEQLSN